MKQIVDLWYDLPQSNQRYQLNPARGLVKAGRSNILSPISDGNGGRVYVLYFDRVGERHMSYQQLIDELFPDGIPEIDIPNDPVITATEPVSVEQFVVDIEADIAATKTEPVVIPADEDTVIINPPTQEKSNGTVAVSDGSAVERNELPIVTDARDDGSQPIDTGSIGETETADQTAQPVEPTEQVTEPENVVEMATTDPVVERPIESTQLVEPVVPVMEESNESTTTETSGETNQSIPEKTATETVESVAAVENIEPPAETVTDTSNAEQTPETVSEPTPVDVPVEPVSASEPVPEVSADISVSGSDTGVVSVDPVVEPVSESEPVTETNNAVVEMVSEGHDDVSQHTETVPTTESVSESGSDGQSESVEPVGTVGETASGTGMDGVESTIVESSVESPVSAVTDTGSEPAHQNVLVESESGSADGKRTESNAPESPVTDVSVPDDSNIVPTPENAVQTQPDTLNDVPTESVPAEPPIDGVEVVPETPKPTKLTVADSARLVQERLAAGATVDELAVKFKTSVEKIQKLAAMKL